MKKLVIVVEDDDAILMTTKRLLELAGYVVVISQHPDELMEKLELFRPALTQLRIGAIITDIQMPGNGQSVISRVAADPDFKNIRVIPMSASQGTLVFGKRVVKKPFTIDDLIEAIERK